MGWPWSGRKGQDPTNQLAGQSAPVNRCENKAGSSKKGTEQERIGGSTWAEARSAGQVDSAGSYPRQTASSQGANETTSGASRVSGTGHKEEKKWSRVAPGTGIQSASPDEGPSPQEPPSKGAPLPSMD